MTRRPRRRGRHRVLAALAAAAIAASLFAPAAYASGSPDAARPSGLSASAQCGGVRLDWAAPSHDTAAVSGYRVLRRLPGIDAVGTFHTIADDTATTTTSYLDPSAATAGQAYTYRVKALRGTQASKWSRYVRIDIDPAGLPPCPPDHKNADEGPAVIDSDNDPDDEQVTAKNDINNPDDEKVTAKDDINDVGPDDRPDGSGDESGGNDVGPDDDGLDGSGSLEIPQPQPEQPLIALEANSDDIVANGFALDSANAKAWGIWANESTVWVADANGSNSKIYAYSRADGSHTPELDFDTLVAAGNTNPRGLWSDGDTMFVVDDPDDPDSDDSDDSVDDKIYAYEMADDDSTPGVDEFAKRVPESDIDLGSYNANPQGIWGDDHTIWVANDRRLSPAEANKGLSTIALYSNAQLYGYRRTDGARDQGKEKDRIVGFEYHFPRGIWSDGQTMFVVGKRIFGEVASVEAYTMTDDPDAAGRTIGHMDLKRTFKLHNDNRDRAGAWSDGTHFLVVDNDDDRVYSYTLRHNATGRPTINHSALRPGQTLAADTSALMDRNGIDDAEISYQWLRVGGTCKRHSYCSIRGATESTYTLTADDVGARIRVKISFRDQEGFNEGNWGWDTYLTSNPTHVITPTT